jgi:hypothetical protein
MSSFPFGHQVDLSMVVTPASGGSAVTVLGPAIKLFELNATNHGWNGVIEFTMRDDLKVAEAGKEDLLLPWFFESPLITIELSVEAIYSNVVGRDPDEKVVWKGIVLKRSMRELFKRDLEISVQTIERRYRIEVCDAAKALWGQHHPCQLYTKKTFYDILDEHKPEQVTFAADCDWSWASEKDYLPPMFFFALDPSIGPASFYDWIMWYLDRHQLIWRYDLRKNEYAIVKTKTDGSEVRDILRADFQDWSGTGESKKQFSAVGFHLDGPGLTIEMPEVPRHKPEVINSFTGATVTCTEDLANEYKVEKIKKQTLMRTPLAGELDRRAKLERARLVTKPTPIMNMVFQKIPTRPIYPGDLVQYRSEAEKALWPGDSWQLDKGTFRVFEVSMTGKIAKETDLATAEKVGAEKPNWDLSGYKLTLTARAEKSTDTKLPRLPRYVEPVYPVFVEGKILSNIDETDEKSLTYQPQPVEDSILSYRVEVPLWSTTAAEIVVPHNAGRMPGQLFFPALKSQRVVLAMTWRRAWIDAFVDWREDVRLPAQKQGNRMLLGKKLKSSTYMENYYDNQDAVQPIFKIHRTSDRDLQTLCISEGNMLIEVTEEEIAPATEVSADTIENIDDGKQA